MFVIPKVKNTELKVKAGLKMNEQAMFQKALDFAAKKHDGQYRMGGREYITHPIEVSKILKQEGYGIEYQIAGLFHDLLEDTDALQSEIEALGGKNVLEAVKLVTKYDGCIMDEYIRKIKADPIAKAVKGADRLHNLRSAFDCSDEFKRNYIIESINYYLDMHKDIPEAIVMLAKSLEEFKETKHYSCLNNKTLKKNSFVIKGDICSSISANEMITVKSGYAVCVDGVSKGVFKELPEDYKHLPVADYSGKLVIPGLVDLHIHAPQYSFRGLGMDLELMDWLKKHAFPEESKFFDIDYAKKAYSIFADAMKKSATTHACIFATAHREASELLMELMEETGLISYVGKVNMDREAPKTLCEADADTSAINTFLWINSVNGRFMRSKPILTPRFIPSCTPKLMGYLSRLQKFYSLPVQSHLSENYSEIEFVRELEPESEFYGDAYDSYGLFGKDRENERGVPTIMAHCVHSCDKEIQRMKDNGVFAVHCPASNTNIASGIAPIRKYMSHGLNIGLGSDVAGGHTLSMFSTICSTIQVSKLYWRLIDQNSAPLTFKEAFYLATKGGGSFFSKVGSFEEGYCFSAVVLDDSKLPHPMELSVQERLECAVYSSLDLFGITAKYVNGEKVYGE